MNILPWILAYIQCLQPGQWIMKINALDTSVEKVKCGLMGQSLWVNIVFGGNTMKVVQNVITRKTSVMLNGREVYAPRVSIYKQLRLFPARVNIRIVIYARGTFYMLEGDKTIRISNSALNEKSFIASKTNKVLGGSSPSLEVNSRPLAQV